MYSQYEEIFHINPAPYEATKNLISIHSSFRSRWKGGFTSKSSGGAHALYSLVLQGNYTTFYPKVKYHVKAGSFVINRNRRPCLKAVAATNCDLVRKVMCVRFNAFHDMIIQKLFPQEYTIIELENIQEIEEVMDDLHEEMARLPVPDQAVLSGHFFKLLHRLQKQERKSQLPEALNRALTCLAEQYTNPQLSRKTIAATAIVSTRTLDRLFQRFLHASVNHYLTRYRLGQVCALLHLPYLDIKDIARRCGFADAAYMTRIFKKYQKQTPRDYRQKLEEETAFEQLHDEHAGRQGSRP